MNLRKAIDTALYNLDGEDISEVQINWGHGVFIVRRGKEYGEYSVFDADGDVELESLDDPLDLEHIVLAFSPHQQIDTENLQRLLNEGRQPQLLANDENYVLFDLVSPSEKPAAEKPIEYLGENVEFIPFGENGKPIREPQHGWVLLHKDHIKTTGQHGVYYTKIPVKGNDSN